MSLALLSTLALLLAGPDPERVVTIVHGPPEELPYLYLEALPGAASAADGVPVVLAVEEDLGEAARAFLDKDRPGTMRLVGPPHPELPDAVAARDVWPSGGTVVVAERRLAPAIEAACLATRLGVPLLVDRGALAARLRSLAPARVFAFGDVDVADGVGSVERLAGPVDVARVAGGADYIAVCNVATAEGDAPGAVVAAALAAARDGVVLVVDRPVVRHRLPMTVTDVCPPGLEDVEGVGSYLAVTMKARTGEVIAGAVQTTVVDVAGQSAPRYGRLRIDLDLDGRLEEDEEPRIGSSVDIGGRSYHLTYHYAHPFVAYLRSELVLDEFDPERLRAEIRALARALGSAEYLALVGTPDRIPFHYAEATGYFEAYDIKQELPSDASYGDLDDDAAIELAVGRLPVEELADGSAFVATTLAYPRFAGDWRHRAAVIQPGFHEQEGALPWVLPNAEALIRGVEGDLVAAGVEVRPFYRSDVAVEDVLDAISGSAWVAYFNHSGPGTWGIHPGTSIVTRAGREGDHALEPLDGAPIVFGGGCSSAALDVGQPLDVTFPGRFFELGAVAYLGNTRVAYARSEHLVQPFFAGLASGDKTLGQAFRDGRNLLAHLLEGGHLVGRLDLGVDLGDQEFLWGQHRIMNLFGDPALRPHLPDGVGAAVDVRLARTARDDRMRLVVTYDGDERSDPVLMTPASGQGRPREFFVRTGAGLTSSHLPYHFVRPGLEWMHSSPWIQPGAWVDVALPVGAGEVRVQQSSGPAWADRGFAIRRGARGEPRLQMFVPLVRARLEDGAGEVARRVEFDVACTAHGAGATSVTRVRDESPATDAPAGAPQIDAAAEEVLARVAARHGRAGPAGLTWRMKNPRPRLYGAADFHGRWRRDGTAEVEARGLSDRLASREREIEAAIGRVASLPFASPLPPLAGMRVTAPTTERLVMTPLADEDDPLRVEIDVRADGTVVRVVRRRFGISEETRLEWVHTAAGAVLARSVTFDPVRPHRRVVHEVDWTDHEGRLVPDRVTVRLPGILPRDVHFTFRPLVGL